MAQKDHVLDQLLADKERFADLFNAGLFQGRQLLRPDMLERVSGKSGISYLDQDGKSRTRQRLRDVIMKADFGAYFAMFACEDQAEVHYAMPVRCALYDALNYTDQIREMEKKHRAAGDLKTKAEFLSGMKKEDRIIPVFSIVLYLGKDEWDGSRSLHEMMGCGKEGHELLNEIKAYLPDYRINLLWARNIEDIQIFRSSLQHFFGMLKYSNSKNDLYKYVHQHRDEIRNLDEASITAILVLLGEQKRLGRMLEENHKKEDFDMCKAIDELIADGEKKGMILGETIGESKSEERYSRLILKLLEDGKSELIGKAAADSAFLKQLYAEYHL